MSAIDPSPPSPSAADYGRYCRPGLSILLEAVGLDVAYEAGEGDRLWYANGSGPVEVLDFVGGYGSTLFGHNHPELVAEARRLLDLRLPIMVQGSRRAGAAQLARALCERLGDFVVTFTNSGTESVEAALKHARLETGRDEFWAVKGGFHGKTLGAVQLSQSHGRQFGGLGPRVRFLDPWDPGSWDAESAHAQRIAAVVVEPVLGEGGVHPLPADFVAWLREVCAGAGIPIVADEIQSGMGRCGTFLASERIGLDPDYICLAKALGGGIVKIGALLVKRERYVPQFSVIQTSTFAEDEYTSRVALKALELVERDRIPQRCAETGEWLRGRLEALREAYPQVIKEVRGFGLMLGLELHDLTESHSNMLRLLSTHRFLGPTAAAYLLNVHRIRILPTLSQPFTLRIQPSAYVSREDCGRLLDALEMLCQALRERDAAHLTAYQVGLPTPPVTRANGARVPMREPARSPRRVAFIGHLLLPEHMHLWDAAFARLPAPQAAELMSRTSRIVGLTVFNEANVRSAAGVDAHLTFIGLNLSAAQILEHRRMGEFRWIMDQIEEAVALARDLGCTAVGLGGYTSIVSANCMRVKTTGIGLTSGNALTVGMALRGLASVAEQRGIALEGASVGIVGAGGNTASTCAMLLAPQVAEMVFIARRTDSIRVERLMQDVAREAPGVRLRVSNDMHELRRCSLIVSASNDPDPIIFPEHLAPGPVAICDISAPSDVDESVRLLRPDVAVFDGGIVRLPCNPDFEIPGVPLGPGRVFACMAETILMGLEQTNSHGSYGRIEPEQVRQTLRWADRHGFTLAVEGM